MTLFFILLYALLCAVHLIFCALEKDTLCAMTKCLLMPLLAVSAISFALQGESCKPYTLFLLAAALSCGTAGDAFLLRSSDRAFITGALCFLAGHAAWMLAMRKAVAACPAGGIAAWAIVSALLLFFLWRMLGSPRGIMGASAVVYGLFLMALAGTGIAAVHKRAWPPSFMFLAGSVFFLISDGVLAYDRFAKRIAHSNFIVMLTYIAAQTMLSFAVVMAM